MGAFRHSPGCQCCEQEVDCACFHEILGQVVILELAGVVNRPCCSNCGDFNGTYILPPYPWGSDPCAFYTSFTGTPGSETETFSLYAEAFKRHDITGWSVNFSRVHPLYGGIWASFLWDAGTLDWECCEPRTLPFLDQYYDGVRECDFLIGFGSLDARLPVPITKCDPSVGRSHRGVSQWRGFVRCVASRSAVTRWLTPCDVPVDMSIEAATPIASNRLAPRPGHDRGDLVMSYARSSAAARKRGRTTGS
jgi:hypothetical protein